MSRHARVAVGLGLWCSLAIAVRAADPDHDFSGKWTLDAAASRLQGLTIPADPVLTIVQQETAIHSSTNATYALDGSETKYKIGDTRQSSAVKWEGAALLINTLVSGPRDYTVMDRWKLSADGGTLTITRQVVDRTGQSEGVLVYRGDNWRAPAAAAPLPGRAPERTAEREPAPERIPAAVAEAPRPVLIRPQPREAARAGEGAATIPAGTHIALALRNTVDTKHSKEGDRIYLETIYPVSAEGRIAIPRGSFVNGTVTISKPAGRVKGKGELFIRFDSLTLPSGATRDFRSRLDSASGANVNRDEGKVTGERDTGKDVGRVAEGTVMGASLGGLIGAAKGSALKGAGIGSAAGAAVGLGSVLLKKGPDATLRQGTTMDMILDRDLTFTSAELRW